MIYRQLLINSMTNLYLFDIDGTLTNNNAFHRKTYQQEVKKLTGVTIPEEKIEAKFGMGEEEMFNVLFKEYRVDTSIIPKVIEGWDKKIFEHLKKEKLHCLPGVLPFLNRLKERGQVMGIITGNPQNVGEATIKSLGIASFFSVFGYADKEDRGIIVKRVIKQAPPHDRAIVIGDSPSDIKAGKAAGALTVGVATGFYSRDQLTTADLVLSSLEEYEKILKLLAP